MVVPCAPFEKFAKERLEKTGTKITHTHLALKAIGHALSLLKGVNGKIIFGRFKAFPDVGVSTLIDLDGKDLTQTTVNKVDKKTITEIAKECRDIVKAVKTKKNTDHRDKTRFADFLPDWAVNIATQLTGFIMYNLGIDVPPLKVAANGFGSVLLTNVSGLGYKEAYAPLCNFTRNAITAVLCTPYWTQTFDDNGENAKVEKVINFMWTGDHRFIDGSAGSVILKGIDEVFRNPEKFDQDYEI